MEINFQIIFEFLWYASFGLTVTIEEQFENGLPLIKAKFISLDQTKSVYFFLGYPEFISVDIFFFFSNLLTSSISNHKRKIDTIFMKTIVYENLQIHVGKLKSVTLLVKELEI